jgi:hypothetical protein
VASVGGSTRGGGAGEHAILLEDSRAGWPRGIALWVQPWGREGATRILTEEDQERADERVFDLTP